MNETLREEFNQWARDGRGAQLESHHRWFLEDTLTQMNIRPHGRILDLGCGEGWTCRLLAPLVPEGSVIGLDVSDEMIRRARAQSSSYENLLFLWGDAEEIPWQGNFFSEALCLEAFYYFENPEKVLREIHRVLAPGGSLWIVNHLSKENELSLRWLKELRVGVQIMPAEEYGSLLERCGYADFSYRMIPDRTPLSDYSYDRWFPDPADLRRFRELGALMLTASKPAR